MKDKRTFKCMASCKERVEFNMALKEKQICPLDYMDLN